MSLLEVAHLRKSFAHGRPVLNDLSFSVEEGEVFGLLGPNGAGKSVTISIVSGLLTPDEGTVTISGHPMRHGDFTLQKQLGLAPQELAFYPDLSARENLEFFGSLYGLSGGGLGKRVDFILEEIGLTDRARDRAGEFSGGMKRRLNFGIAIIHSPRLLILDEPTVGVDPQSRTHLLDGVRRLSQEGVTVVYCSHYMEEVESLCSRVAIVDKGTLLACDTVSKLLSRMSSDLCLFIAPNPELHKRIPLTARLELAEHGDAKIILTAKPATGAPNLNDQFQEVLLLLKEFNAELHRVESRQPNLDRLFIEMTGRQLRD